MQGCGCNAWTSLKDKIGCNSGLRGGLLQAKQDECILHEVGWEEIIGNWFQCLRCCWELLLSTHGARIAALHRIKDDWEAAQLSGLRESVKPTFLGSMVCNELYYWATRSRKTCLERISNSHCKSRGLNVLLASLWRCSFSTSDLRYIDPIQSHPIQHLGLSVLISSI